jgi:hypothetical protein
MEQPDETSVQPSFPKRSVLVITILLLVAGGIMVFLYAEKLNTRPEQECAYRGGTWVPEDQECVFAGAGKDKREQQVGTVTNIRMVLPDIEPPTTVSFTDVEVGSRGSHGTEFDVEGSPVAGSATLIPELGRVRGETGDLVMPFVVYLKKLQRDILFRTRTSLGTA